MWINLVIWPNLSPWNELEKRRFVVQMVKPRKQALKTRLLKVITQVDIRDTLTICMRVASYSAFCWSVPPNVEIGVVRAHASLCEHRHDQPWGLSANARGTVADSGVQAGSAARFRFLKVS